MIAAPVRVPRRDAKILFHKRRNFHAADAKAIRTESANLPAAAEVKAVLRILVIGGLRSEYLSPCRDRSSIGIRARDIEGRRLIAVRGGRFENVQVNGLGGYADFEPSLLDAAG